MTVSGVCPDYCETPPDGRLSGARRKWQVYNNQSFDFFHGGY